MTPKTLAQASSAWRNLAGEAGQFVAIEWNEPGVTEGQDSSNGTASGTENETGFSNQSASSSASGSSSEPETLSGPATQGVPQELSESDRLRYQSIRSTPRRAAFLAGRRALALLAESAQADRREFKSQARADESAALSLSSHWPEGPDALLSLEPRGWFASISHSAGLAVALGVPVASEPRWLGVGVDLERADRVIEDAVAARILSESEQALGIPPLLAWSLKEAAFKADDSPSPTWVSLYQVVEFNGPELRALLRIEDPVSPREFQASWVLESGWQLAFCVRKS